MVFSGILTLSADRTTLAVLITVVSTVFSALAAWVVWLGQMIGAFALCVLAQCVAVVVTGRGRSDVLV